MTFVLPLLLGSIITAWSMLALLGNEHERRAKQIASAPKPKAKESDNAAPAPQPSKPPAASKVVR